MIKINKLEIENTKRIKAVKIEPKVNGLTIVGGKNSQGKTSVLDAIAWALGGDKYRPSGAARKDSVIPPNLHIVLSNGLIVDRKGKNSSLTVTDPSGQKAGQRLLDEFVSQLALDLPKFMNASDKEKANILLQIIGVGDQLAQLEHDEKVAYNERLAIGRIADQKSKFAKEQPYYPDAPKELVSASDLIQQQQDILARNAQKQQWMRDYDAILDEIEKTKTEIDIADKTIKDLKEHLKELEGIRKVSEKDPKELELESTEELEGNIRDIDEINRKVRANLDKDKAEEDAREYAAQYEQYSVEIEEIRKKKMELLDGADLPLPGLSVEDGCLTYDGNKWDCLSSSEQLKVSTAIVRKMNPECGFVLLDKLEQMDLDTLEEFGKWLEQEGLQAIATRVSTGKECQIIIEDGYSVINEQAEAQDDEPAWKKGF